MMCKLPKRWPVSDGMSFKVCPPVLRRTWMLDYPDLHTGMYVHYIQPDALSFVCTQCTMYILHTCMLYKCIQYRDDAYYRPAACLMVCYEQFYSIVFYMNKSCLGKCLCVECGVPFWHLLIINTVWFDRYEAAFVCRFKPTVTVSVQDGTGDTYGKRLRKSLQQVRRTVDYVASVLNYSEVRFIHKVSF